MTYGNTTERARARRRLSAAGVEVLAEDNHVLSIAKPAGLLSQGGPTDEVHLVTLLDAYRREAEAKPGRAFVGLVHRLDRNVSGVMVVAKTSKAARRLAALFRDRSEGLRKVYRAWVAGHVSPEEGVLAHRLRRGDRVTRLATADDDDGHESLLTYRVEGRGAEATRLQVELGTGRTHQIRAQWSIEGHPLFGDSKYGGPRGARPALHAARLVLPHPVRAEILDLSADVPDDLRQLDRTLAIDPGLRSQKE